MPYLCLRSMLSMWQTQPQPFICNTSQPKYCLHVAYATTTPLCSTLCMYISNWELHMNYLGQRLSGIKVMHYCIARHGCCASLKTLAKALEARQFDVLLHLLVHCGEVMGNCVWLHGQKAMLAPKPARTV